MSEQWIDIVFDGPPEHESGRFVEVENPDRASLRVGQWIERDDGYWVLRLPDFIEMEQAFAVAQKQIETLEKLSLVRLIRDVVSDDEQAAEAIRAALEEGTQDD